MKNKNARFTFLYAIGSILIVSGHCFNGGINLAFDFFQPYYFHLALFTFVSGYFYKEENENHVLSYIWKKIKKLIIPMYVINFFFGLFVLITKQFGFQLGSEFNLYNLIISPITNGHQFVYNLCFWFVVPLFCIECFNVLLKKYTKKFSFLNEYVYFIIYLILGILALWISKNEIESGILIALLRFLFFLPFYQLGTLYNKKIEKKDNMNNVLYFTILFMIQLIIFLSIKQMPHFNPAWLKFEGYMILPYIEAILGIAFWVRVAKILENITKDSKIINLIADNAFAIMAYQLIGFFVIKLLCEFGHNYTSYFVNFNPYAFRNDMWYFYIPRGVGQTLIVYLVAGIMIPIGIQKLINIGKEKAFSYYKNNKETR